DTANIFTRIEKGGLLSRKEASKEKRYDRNLVGVGLVASSTNLPLMHETFPGNKSDAYVFKTIIDALVSHLQALSLDASKLVAVFDRGSNSPEALEALRNKQFHLVGCLKKNQAKEYLKVRRSSFHKVG
ncbi:MAG: transposase, partial [Thermoplasmatota archaeon]